MIVILLSGQLCAAPFIDETDFIDQFYPRPDSDLNDEDGFGKQLPPHNLHLKPD